MGFSLGGSKNKSSSSQSSSASSYGENEQNVWGSQTAGLEGLYAAAQGILGGQGGAAGAQDVGEQARASWMQALQPGGNPYFSQNVQGALDAASSSFKRSVLPELESRGVGAGQYGNSRDQLARGEAAGMFGDSLSQMARGMYSDQYGMDQQRQLAALGMTGNMQATNFAPQFAAQQLIGGPTVLGSGWQSSIAESSSKSKGKGSSASGGK